MKTRYVLAIDGGGVRGIVAAVLLDALEGEIRAAGYTGPLSDCFDVIAGTSTGAIIAGALAAPDRKGKGPLLTPAALRDLYRREARTIFPAKSGLPFLAALRQYKHPLYSPKPLQRILDDYFGNLDFITPRRNLLITAYSLEPRDVIYFRGGPHTPPGDPAFAGTIRLADAIMGASAAPTFFPPHEVINRRTGKRRTVIDGAVFINDPAVAALAEAIRLFPDDDVKMVSVGTGRVVQPIPFETARRWGFSQWISPKPPYRVPLLSTIFDGQARAVHSHMTELLGDRYHRFDYDLESGYGAAVIDDSSQANMRCLETGALKMAEDMRPRLRLVAQDLVANRHARDSRAGRKKG